MGYYYDVYKNGNLICKGVTAQQVSEKIGIPSRYVSDYALHGNVYQGIYQIKSSSSAYREQKKTAGAIPQWYRECFEHQWEQVVAPFRGMYEERRFQ